MDPISADLLSLPWSPRVIRDLAGHLGHLPVQRIYTDRPSSDWDNLPVPTPHQLQLHRFCVEKAYLNAVTTFNGIAEEFGFNGTLLLYMLESTSSIIGGSFALCVLHPGMFSPADIDIYTRFGNGHLMEDYLAIFGYRKDDRSCDHYPGSPVHSVLTFVRTSDTTKTINLIYTNESPILAITQFHSTLVMNYIAWYGVVCLYPSLTLRKEGVALQVWAEACYRKYALRGFKLTPVTISDALVPGPRSIQDPDTWFLPFSTVLSSDRYDLAYLEKDQISWNNLPEFHRKQWENAVFDSRF